MEQITKQQVILIALLVAIITAISTSVATVSLLDNPGGGPQQTIYKVIERSIETVANIPTVKEAVSTAKQSSASAELSPSDIAANGAKSIIRIYEKVGNDKKFVALGIAVGSKNGALSSAPLAELANGLEYVAVTADSHEIKASLSKTGLPAGFAFFVLNYDTGEKSKVSTIEIKSNPSLKLGANVVALGGKEEGNVVSTGIITELLPLEGGAATSTDKMSTDMALSSALSGWLLFDTSGNLVGFETGINENKTGQFINGGLVKAALAGLL